MSARDFCLKHAATLWRDTVLVTTERPTDHGSGVECVDFPMRLDDKTAAIRATERALALYTEICESVAEPSAGPSLSERFSLGYESPTPRPRQAPEGRVEYFARCVCGGRTTVSVDAKDRPPAEFATAGYLFCGRCGATVPAGADPTREG
jgi:hypothetical protein